MAENEVRIKVTGQAKGVKAAMREAAAEARTGGEKAGAGFSDGFKKGSGSKSGGMFDGLFKDVKKLEGAADKAESALMGIGKGLLALSSAGSAVSVIGGVAAAATQASGALLLMPGALAAVRIGLGAINMGAGDFLDSLSNLGNDKAWKKNFEAMGDTAKSVAGEIKSVYNILAEDLDEKMFAGIHDKLKPLIDATLPQLKAAYDGIAKSVNRTGLELLDFLNQSSKQADLNKLIGDSSAIWDQLLKSVVPLGSAFLDIAVVGSQALKEMTGGIGDAAKRFADFIAKARASGQIRKWIDSGVQAFKDMWHIVENVGSTIGSVFRGLGVDMGSPLGMLRDLTQRMAEFMASAGAQEGLHTLGDALKTIGQVVGWVAQTALRQLAETLVAVAPVAATVAKTLGVLLVGALNVLGPIIRVIADVLAEFPVVTVAATTALIGFVVVMKSIKAVNAVSEMLGLGTAIGGVGTKAETAAAKTGLFAGKLGMLKGLGAGLAVAAVAIELDKVNVKAAGSAEKLGLFEGQLHNIVGAAGQVASGDVGGIFSDISRQLGEVVTQFKTAQSPIGQFFHWLSGQKPDPIPITADTADATGNVAWLMSQIKGTSGTVEINGRTEDAAQALADIKQAINQGQGTVTINGQDMPAQQALQYVISQINAGAGTVTVNGQTVPAGQELAALLGRVNASRASIGVGAETSAANGAIAGLVNNWNGRHINLIVTTTGSGGIASAGRLAGGGPVSGPGTGTSDTAGLYALSNGEYVATAKQVGNAGGPAGFGRLMAALDRGPVAGRAAGGPAGSPARAAPAPSGTGVAVTFTGNTSDALATVIMQLVRTGKIQLKAA